MQARVISATSATALIISMPPAMTTSPIPVMIACAAIATVCRPDEQKRLIVARAHLDRKARAEDGEPRRVEALRRLGHRAPPEHVVDERRIELHPVDGRAHHGGGKIDGVFGGERAVLLARPTAVRTALTMTTSLVCMVLTEVGAQLRGKSSAAAGRRREGTGARRGADAGGVDPGDRLEVRG